MPAMVSLAGRQAGDLPHTREQAVAEASSLHALPKPVPQSQAQDPRKYQLEQLRKRFSPKELKAPDGSTSLVFRFAPSDPDFAFDLAHLECDLRVPQSYPEERPQLLVRNKDIPRGFSINVERGWEKLASERTESTLLALVKALDKNLEGFLSEQKVETVKLVSFKDTRHIQQPVEGKPAAAAPPVQPIQAPRQYFREPSYTKEQIAESKARRAQEVRQLEARMGRLPMFRRSADGVVFTLPIEPKRRKELPSGLQSVNSLHLIVPLLYPLQDIRVQLNEAEAVDAEPVEDLFVEKAAGQKQMTLMSHVNYLTQNIHILAKQAQTQALAAQAAKAETPSVTDGPQVGESPAGPSDHASDEKGHVQYITRPPEWSLGHDEEDSEEYTDSDEDGGVAIGGGAESAGENAASAETPERGTMISFPSIELHGIELLQISLLSIGVKCDRCRTPNDMTGLRPGVEKTSSCKKCATTLAAQFNQRLVHANSTRAGFIDLSGCKVADMLPSTFVPTCEKCSTPSAGLVSVRGENTTNVCRECHGKFSFKIPEVKFLFISPGSLAPPSTGPRRKTERLGLHAGEPLPDRGACAHYKKSFRWFRFSCCNRVHPCDRCHEEAEDHVNEWANRMICGFCSREQNYAVDACNFCGRSVIGRKGRGFWEGGKGTRDQRFMSRKDPRKYKRIGTTPGAKKD